MPVRVSLRTIGSLPYSIAWGELQSRKSELYRIVSFETGLDLPVHSDEIMGAYSDELLEYSLPPKHDQSDFELIICNIPLVNNYYGRVLSGNRFVISLLNISPYLLESKIPITNFIFRKIYSSVVLFQTFNPSNLGASITSEQAHTLYNHRDEGCIFDMNVTLYTVVYSLDPHLRLSESSRRNILLKNNFSSTYFEKLESELKKIRTPLHLKLARFFEEKTITSIIIIAVIGISLNILSNWLYDLLR